VTLRQSHARVPNPRFTRTRTRTRGQAGLIGGNHLNWGSFPPIEFQNLPQLSVFIGLCAL